MAFRTNAGRGSNGHGVALFSGSGSVTTPANQPPATPTISAGVPTSSGATLTGSAFSDPDVGDTHAASQWQVTTAADTGFASPVYNPGDDATNKTSLVWSGGSASTGYLARVRYKDSAGNYSAWATSASFTTAAAAGSSITKLASVGVQGNTGTTTSGAIDTTGATLLVVGVSFYNLGPTPTVSDSKGNTWTALTASSDAGNNMHVKLFYCASPTVGTGHTFTINGTGIYGSLAAIAFSGTTASPFDVEHQHEAQGTITTVQPGSITPSLQHEVLVTGISHGQDGTTLSVDSGYTKEVDIASNAGGTGVFGVALAYLIQGAAAASNPTWTSSATANYLSSTIASFKATS